MKAKYRLTLTPLSICIACFAIAAPTVVVVLAGGLLQSLGSEWIILAGLSWTGLIALAAVLVCRENTIDGPEDDDMQHRLDDESE